MNRHFTFIKIKRVDHLYFQVQLHISPALVVWVFPQYKPEWRLSFVQVTVLQQVLLLGFSPGDQLVLLIVVPEEKKNKQKQKTLNLRFT